jgi:ATP-dependent Lhr-like helicase
MPSRSGPPAAAGRWSLLPERDTDPTRHAHALAEALLERHGVLTRGAVAAERVPGGFAAVYPVLRALEESGRIRRGYFVDGLGAAQFAVPGAVDRLRATSDAPSRGSDPPGWAAPGPDTGPVRPPVRTAAPGALLLSATDPANPYGAALPWPDRQGGSGGVRAAGTQTAGTQTAETRTAETRPSAGHRPGRKAGALVVLVEGELTVYVERGGATLLSWTEDPERLTAAVDALALAVRDGLLGRLTVERADGSAVAGSVLGQILERAGFNPTPRGLRLRA